MRKLIAAGFTAALIAGGGAFAASAAPGPNGHNNYGLCNAYLHNNENAKDAPPFAALEAAAEAADQTVEEWCAANGQKPGKGGGNQ